MSIPTTSNDSLANKGEVRRIIFTDEQVRILAEHLVDEYGGKVDERIAEIMRKPDDVGVLYTTFDEEDEYGVYIDEHEIQISMNLYRGVNMLYVDNVLVYEEPIAEGDHEFYFDGWLDYFGDIARDLIPSDEQIDNEHNPYMDEHKELIRAIERSNELADKKRDLKIGIMERFDLSDILAWSYANEAYEDGLSLDEISDLIRNDLNLN